jgi:ribonuclease E
MPRESEFSHAGPPAAEPPRRKSTVREPVPFPIDDEAPQQYSVPSAPQPVTSIPTPVAPAEQPQDDDGKPRRTGWWAKRLLGG